MSDDNVIEVTDREGWKKIFPLTKSIIYVGSDARNDIVLEAVRGAGVARRHLQLISVTGGSGYRAINMGDTPINYGQAGESTLAPRAFVELNPGEKIKVGEFTLSFQGDVPMSFGNDGGDGMLTAGDKRSKSIG